MFKFITYLLIFIFMASCELSPHKTPAREKVKTEIGTENQEESVFKEQLVEDVISEKQLSPDQLTSVRELVLDYHSLFLICVKFFIPKKTTVIHVEWTVRSSGEIRDVHTTANKSFTQCVHAVLLDIPFPDLQKEGERKRSIRMKRKYIVFDPSLTIEV